MGTTYNPPYPLAMEAGWFFLWAYGFVFLGAWRQRRTRAMRDWNENKAITLTLVLVVIAFVLMALTMSFGLLLFLFTGRTIPDLQTISGIVAVVGLAGPATAIIVKFLERITR